jgi:protein CpxP
MRKLILSAILFISMGTIAMAQTNGKKDQKTPEERAQRATDVMDKKLALTVDQKAKVYAINLEDMRKPKAKHVKGEKRDMAAIKVAMDARDSKINNILDEKQRVSYKEWKEKRKQGLKDRDGKRKGDKGPKINKV